MVFPGIFTGFLVKVRDTEIGGGRSAGFGRTGVALGSLAAEKIVKTPALLVALVVGVVGLASASGVANAGALGMGATGSASAAGVPVLFAMALAAVPAGAGSSATFFRWNLPSFFEPLRRAGGFMATPGVPSTKRRATPWSWTCGPERWTRLSGKFFWIVWRRLICALWTIRIGKLHVEFVVGNTPTPEDVDRITQAFRQLAASSSLSKSSVGQITVGVVAQRRNGWSEEAQLSALSPYHINVVAPASEVKFWSDLGMP